MNRRVAIAMVGIAACLLLDGLSAASWGEEGGLHEAAAMFGVSFPRGSILISSSDGGGRDSSFGFREWVVYSPVSVVLPAMHAAGVNGYLTMPLADTMKFVESRMHGRRVTNAQNAFSTEWQRNGYSYNATVIQTTGGDYLVVEQFRENNEQGKK